MVGGGWLEEGGKKVKEMFAASVVFSSVLYCIVLYCSKQECIAVYIVQSLPLSMYCVQ